MAGFIIPIFFNVLLIYVYWVVTLSISFILGDIPFKKLKHYIIIIEALVSERVFGGGSMSFGVVLRFRQRAKRYLDSARDNFAKGRYDVATLESEIAA